jgi:hypothetical protein
MTSIPTSDYIAKISLLEARRGAATSYKILEPFPIAARDSIGMQKAAKEIADFVGLSGFTFIVTLTKLKKDIGGHIELNYSHQEVFIEISEDTATFPEAILATLAHEIAHKYLHFHSISAGSGLAYKYENEILTDITAIFLGLGKLMLNGSEVKRIHQEQLSNGTQTTTHTLKSGYLNREQLAFIYLLVCSMRSIDQQVSNQFLTMESRSELQAARKAYPHYFDGQFRQADIRKTILERLTHEMVQAQSVLSVVDRDIHSLNQRYLDPVHSFRSQAEKLFDNKSRFVETQTIDNELDPCLRYLNAIRLDNQTTEHVQELKSLTSQAMLLVYNFRPLSKFLRRHSGPFLGSRQRSIFSKLSDLLRRKH